MTEQNFQKFWNIWSKQWFETQTCFIDGETTPVSFFCTITPDYGKELHRRYEIIKAVFKEKYFSQSDDSDIRLNKYKRAAVIAYAICGAAPLVYSENELNQLKIDRFFLKQRLAFYVALGSIVQEYPRGSVEEITSRKLPLFSFPALTEAESIAGADDFLTSIYKDMFYSQIYNNFNVLTMANLFWTLTQCASPLRNVSPLPPTKP